jgi:signal transduction histidine kinase
MILRFNLTVIVFTVIGLVKKKWISPFPAGPQTVALAFPGDSWLLGPRVLRRRGRHSTLQGVTMKETDLPDLVRDSLSSLSIPASIRIHLRFDMADRKAQIDRGGMKTLFFDLARNAVEAMPAGGDLTIGIDGDGEVITIVVEDTGCGISPEGLEQLFIPFFSTKPVGEGTGLGLPSVYATVKGHGGRIAVESNADAQKGPTGTKVRITLPRRPPGPTSAVRVIVHDD